MRVIVDGLEDRAVGGLAAHEPFGAAIVGLSLGMPLLNRLLDLDCVKLPLVKARLRVLGPDKALDLHGSKPTRRRSERVASQRAED
jgi:hypothetical protein